MLRPVLLATLLAVVAFAAWRGEWMRPQANGESVERTGTAAVDASTAPATPGKSVPVDSPTASVDRPRDPGAGPAADAAPVPVAPARAAGDLVQDAGGPRMAWIPPAIGTRSVPRGFALSLHEVTRDEYAAFVRATGHASARCRDTSNPVALLRSRDWQDPGFSQSGREPVVCIGADDATAYAGWISRRTGQRYHLPTSAQWRHAAALAPTRGDACKLGNLYDGGARRMSLAARHDCDDGYAQLAPVGSYRASAYGVRDLVGNAREWLADCERRGTQACAERAVAGSSFRDGERKPLLPGDRTQDPASGAPDIGFRLMREVDD